MHRGNTKQSGEQGMVSILVTMIMMIVISLIIVGMSQVTRSNQREQLNQQLNTQAYYAAESGLNQAVKFFSANPTANLNTSGNCTQFITSAAPNGLGATVGVDNILNSSSNVSYTCLMVNSTPASLQKAPLTEDSNTVWRLHDAAGNPFKKFDFKWAPNSKSRFTGAANTCNTTGFPSYGNWKCPFGILRLDLVDTSGTVSSSTLEGVSKTIYFVPTYNSSGVTSAPTKPDQAQVLYVQCTTSLCDLNLIMASESSSEYFARLSIIYQSSDSVQLSGTDSSGVAQFAGGQAVIDVTGKAQDELRRVQARVPLTVSDSPIPNFALQTTDDLCKQLAVAPTVDATDSCP